MPRSGRPARGYLPADLALLLDGLFGAPQGYFLRLWATSWLDYAVATMDARTPHLEYLWDPPPGWPEDVETDDLREAARVELAQLREAPWAACPGIECIDGRWVFAGTMIPVAELFEALRQGLSTVDERYLYCAPGITAEQIQAVFSHVCGGLKPKTP